MSYQTTNPAGAKALLESEPAHVYIDVRSVEEFDQGHVPGAFNIPILFKSPAGMQPNPDFAKVVARHFAQDARIVFGCKAGGRSQRACELLSGQGYAGLVNMAGGFHGAFDELGRLVEKGWAASGFSTTRDGAPERSWRALSGGA